MFLGVVVGLVFFDRVLPRFLFYSLVFRSRKCPVKILFMSGLLFWGLFVLSLSLVFRRRRLFVFVVFQKERKLRPNRTHPTLHCLVLFFSFLVPAALGLSPVLAVRPFFLAFCRCAILGPKRFWIPGAPLRLFLGRKAAWVLVVNLSVVFVFPLLWCLRLHFFLGPSRRSTPEWAIQRVP